MWSTRVAQSVPESQNDGFEQFLHNKNVQIFANMRMSQMCDVCFILRRGNKTFGMHHNSSLILYNIHVKIALQWVSNYSPPPWPRGFRNVFSAGKTGSENCVFPLGFTPRFQENLLDRKCKTSILAFWTTLVNACRLHVCVLCSSPFIPNIMSRNQNSSWEVEKTFFFVYSTMQE